MQVVEQDVIVSCILCVWKDHCFYRTSSPGRWNLQGFWLKWWARWSHCIFFLGYIQFSSFHIPRSQLYLCRVQGNPCNLPEQNQLVMTPGSNYFLIWPDAHQVISLCYLNCFDKSPNSFARRNPYQPSEQELLPLEITEKVSGKTQVC